MIRRSEAAQTGSSRAATLSHRDQARQSRLMAVVSIAAMASAIALLSGMTAQADAPVVPASIFNT
ncbi:hypothetical protein [Phenylobacterium sp.]|uniref:hypothetical protein n=1 Tax=Phenylobacterium sp. TaxID=1871053 RepID=UPI0027303CD6|nr:hypothetical protein [Phenylobacterium sp.]MDP1617082.1 hypothetical protein [Phenylobacterium sp.]